MPMVVLEAWRNNMAVLSTPVGAMPDMLYENYLEFDFDDVEGLARQLGRLMEDEELRTRLGENGRKLVEERFSMEKIENDLRKIYQHFFINGLPTN